MVVVGDVLGAPETGGWMDGVQNVETSSNARTATSIASREGGDGRLELGVGVGDLRPWSIALLHC
jgi:hypothetical protein